MAPETQAWKRTTRNPTWDAERGLTETRGPRCPRANSRRNGGNRPGLRTTTWPRPGPAHTARMRPARTLSHCIRALGAPAISRGAASRSRSPFCGGGAPLSASLGHRGDAPRLRVGPVYRRPSPPVGQTPPWARPGNTPNQGRTAASLPPPAGPRPPAARGPWSQCRQGPHHRVGQVPDAGRKTTPQNDQSLLTRK